MWLNELNEWCRRRIKKEFSFERKRFIFNSFPDLYVLYMVVKWLFLINFSCSLSPSHYFSLALCFSNDFITNNSLVIVERYSLPRFYNWCALFSGSPRIQKFPPPFPPFLCLLLPFFLFLLLSLMYPVMVNSLFFLFYSLVTLFFLKKKFFFCIKICWLETNFLTHFSLYFLWDLKIYFFPSTRFFL